MSIVIAILQVIMIIGGYLFYDYIKKIPDQIHKRNLEAFKNELQKEIVKLEVAEGNLHIKKSKSSQSLVEHFTIFLMVLNINKLMKKHLKKMLLNQWKHSLKI